MFGFFCCAMKTFQIEEKNGLSSSFEMGPVLRGFGVISLRLSSALAAQKTGRTATYVGSWLLAPDSCATSRICQPRRAKENLVCHIVVIYLLSHYCHHYRHRHLHIIVNHKTSGGCSTSQPTFVHLKSFSLTDF